MRDTTVPLTPCEDAAQSRPADPVQMHIPRLGSLQASKWSSAVRPRLRAPLTAPGAAATWPQHPLHRRNKAAVPVDHHIGGGDVYTTYNRKARQERSEKGDKSAGSELKKAMDGTLGELLLHDMACSELREVSPRPPTPAPRNAVGVQLLSPALHAQLFPRTSGAVPAVHSEALTLCQHHLKTHGLQPEQASTLDPISFDLPKLQGGDLAEHFWNIGRQAAQPWLGMAHEFAAQEVFDTVPQGIAGEQQDDDSLCAEEWLNLDASVRSEVHPRLPQWLKTPGWVRYPVLESDDGKARALGNGVPVPYPLPEDGSLVFDVETMVQESQFSVMATAASSRAWYAWLSPWLLQQGERCHEKDHLIPFGPSQAPLRAEQPARLLVGHNVGYDRARVQDEYCLKRGNIRFLDTMSLHVATRGISSPQRGAWARHSKSRALEKMLDKDDVEEVKKAVIRSLLGGEEIDEDILAGLDLDQIVQDMADGSTVGTDQLDATSSNDGDISSSASMLWQDLTSKNSLADVAKLHCNIELSKEARDVFIDGTSREEIVGQLDRLLNYCATDVLVTHKVFRKVWPAFVENCPNPATVAGVLGLGSAILPVDDEWVDYIQRSDAMYESALNDVRENLIQLAEQLREQGTEGVSWDEAVEAADARLEDLDSMDDLTYADKLARQEKERLRPKLWWETEAWASQLDWTPKRPKKLRAKSSNPEEGASDADLVPRWYRDKVLKSTSGLGPSMAITPAILRLHVDDRPIVRRADGRWIIQALTGEGDVELTGSPLRQTYLKKADGADVKSKLGPAGEAVLKAIRTGSGADEVRACLREAADVLVGQAAEDKKDFAQDDQLASLDWTPSEAVPEGSAAESDEASASAGAGVEDWWPKWYWDLCKSATGQLEVTIRSKISPLLLRVTWQGCPLHHSREHGWVYRYDPLHSRPLMTRQKPVEFRHPADQPFRNDISRTMSSRLADAADRAQGKDNEFIDPFSITPTYYKVPHLAGDGSNVGSPFSKGFLPLFEKGTMQSEHPNEQGRTAAKNALEMNAQCSYWIGVRDRVRQQMVVWEGQGGSDPQIEAGISGARQADERERGRRKGLILPAIIPMGTVTRRAIEKTWLTASNAKPNRVGSELKALVKAPPGWSIVGADVDSQELWICSVMGDAQFGIHGATAVGWMTLEGSKSMGTDLHSKTAGILGTSRNQAKVFNYSRIYGAGIRHSSQLLLKANPTMSNEEATRKAKALYASTKGTNTYSNEYFGRKFWYGGTESYVFNKLEEIALSEQPKTPALDCGVTAALSRKYLPSATDKKARYGARRQEGGDYMPSRINWVVQSSGVDYLHLLITAMEHLIATYDLQARFMISVHDEVRYLAKDEDRHRVALALQIANLWTRATFAHKLQMDNLPQGVAFFAQVDIDKVLRKEADDPCITPSQLEPIPAGIAVDIQDTLRHTHGGSLHRDGKSMNQASNGAKKQVVHAGAEIDVSLPKYTPSGQTHRSMGDRGLRYLQAQASDNIGEISALEERVRLMEAKRAGRGGQKAAPSTKSTVRSSDSPRPSAATRPSTAARKKPSAGFGGTFSFHSAAHQLSAATPPQLPSALATIVDKFPPRPFRLHVPFYKTREHRFNIRWCVYGRLLRECPAEYKNIHETIRALTRARRHCTSPQKTEALVDRGKTLLDKFRRLKEGDEEARNALTEEDEAIGVKQNERRWNLAADRYLRSLEEERKPVPRISGALLAPSFANPPLPRYKPVQPERITMMILRRRTERFKRVGRQLDNAESQRQLRSEVDMWTRLGEASESDWDDRAQWLQALREQRATFDERFEREQKRAAMVFPASLLRASRLARRKKQVRAEERKRASRTQ